MRHTVAAAPARSLLEGWDSITSYGGNLLVPSLYLVLGCSIYVELKEASSSAPLAYGGKMDHVAKVTRSSDIVFTITGESLRQGKFVVELLHLRVLNEHASYWRVESHSQWRGRERLKEGRGADGGGNRMMKEKYSHATFAGRGRAVSRTLHANDNTAFAIYNHNAIRRRDVYWKD
ncbi:hypothetical protein EVAR_52891_1 [Eumeta japonica]|uniref:Uncharacterized protein n=1 Tax=Eumeta variegata TaxID=151549 RepID=A0A4C1Z0W4_EUMVA|nr:hypothetical protein EVAR_52891_1 [Eumeta japonica]